MRKQIIFEDTNAHTNGNHTTSYYEPDSNTADTKIMKDEIKKAAEEAYEQGLKDARKNQTEENSMQSNPTQQKQSTEKRLEREGKNEGVKEEAKLESQTHKKLQNIIDRQDIILLNATGIFPIELFPDTIIIDTTKISIIKKMFFATERVTTIPLKDISDVVIQTAWFVASLVIKYMPQAEVGFIQPVEVTVQALKRADAIKAKNILKGVMVAKEDDIDIAKVDSEKVKELVEHLGDTKGGVT